jgi:peptide/nickel transport system permease protein
VTCLPVVLPTDALIFILIAVCVGSAAYIRRRPHLALPWRRVGRNPTAMVALLILALFVGIGVLDSLHYRAALPENGSAARVYSPQVLSVFDALAGGLRTRTEKTYSAPLAAHLYAMETMGADGRTTRGYPRLKYGGAQLSDPDSQLAGDVAGRGALGAVLGLIGGFALFAGAAALRRRVSAAPEEALAGTGAGAPPHPPSRQKGALRGLTQGRVARALLIASLVLGACAGAVAALAPAYHVLGTDKVGQDVLFLVLKSIRTGLVIGTVTTLVSLPFAIFLGVAAGYLRGRVDDVIQYVYTVLGSVPYVLLIAAAVLAMQVVIESHAAWFTTAASRADARLLALCVILGVTGWTELARLLRGESMKLRELEYIQAAQAFGVSSLRIMTRHIVPNVMHIVLISVVMSFSQLVLAEAVLSYIGVGVDPTTISFGNMIAAARLEMGREPVVWWPLASAFLFMLLLVLAANLFADAVRDAFDPRQNRS